MNTKNVVIVGATGVVGQEMINCLDKLKFPVGKLRLTASERSAGKVLPTPFGDVTVETISEEVFADSDIALFSAGSDVSREWRERVGANDCLMIDNSSAFRYDDDVPVVVPEINPDAARAHNGVISNPNCTTAILAVALYPLYREYGLKKVISATGVDVDETARPSHWRSFRSPSNDRIPAFFRPLCASGTDGAV